jgi:predicted GTPase
MKCAFVEAFFPELKGKNIYRTGRGEGANNKAAISRAFGDLFKQIKGKRVMVIKSTITLTVKADTVVQEGQP